MGISKLNTNCNSIPLIDAFSIGGIKLTWWHWTKMHVKSWKNIINLAFFHSTDPSENICQRNPKTKDNCYSQRNSSLIWKNICRGRKGSGSGTEVGDNEQQWEKQPQKILLEYSSCFDSSTNHLIIKRNTNNLYILGWKVKIVQKMLNLLSLKKVIEGF